MSKERRGGAHLDKNMHAKKPAPAQKTAPSSSGAAPKKEKARMDRKTKILIAIAAVVLALVLIFCVLKPILDGLFGKDGLLGGLPTVPSYQDTLDPESGDGPVRSEADSVRKKEFYTFLLVGRDTGGGGNTDTIMFCSYDIPNQKVTVMSIPRDTLVDARHPDKNKKINGVWNLGLYYAKKGSTKKGIDYLKEAVGDMTAIVPDFYVIVNWEAFGRLVDAIGGVDFDVPFDMKYRDPTQNLVIDQKGGHRHLSGDDAMQVVRWRHNNSGSVQYADADLGRIRTQQALLKEIIKKCLSFDNVTKLNQFAEIFAEEVETDLTVGNLLAFAERAVFGGLEMDNVQFATMPITATSNGYVQAKPDELLGMLNDSINPYVKELQMEELHILQHSSSRGFYVYQGTGTGTAPMYSTDVKPAQAYTKPETTESPEPSPDASGGPSESDTPSAKPSGAPSDEPDASPARPAESPDASAPASDPPASEIPGEPPKAPSDAPPAEPAPGPVDMGIPME